MLHFRAAKCCAHCANGFGAVALAALAADPAYGATSTASSQDNQSNPLAPRPTHFRPRRKSVIFLFMDGGPSQVDTFDPKPRLDREHGQPIQAKVQPTQFDNVGKVLKSPWKFRQYGQSGIPVSDLFPHMAQCVDELAVIRSMVSNFSEHTNANYFMHSGNGQQGRPSMGAWVTYGLGSECQNLPGFVVLNSGMIPPGGLDCFGSGFLPATLPGLVLHPRHGNPWPIWPHRSHAPPLQQRKLRSDAHARPAGARRSGSDDKLESAIANYELAFRMQSAVPDLMNLAERKCRPRTNSTDSTIPPPRSTAGSAWSRGGWSSAACASSNCCCQNWATTAGISTAN